MKNEIKRIEFVFGLVILIVLNSRMTELVLVDWIQHKSHGSERESSWRERERGHDRERDDDRYSRDTRDYKDRSGRFDRGRNKYSGYSGRRNQDYDRLILCIYFSVELQAVI